MGHIVERRFPAAVIGYPEWRAHPARSEGIAPRRDADYPRVLGGRQRGSQTLYFIAGPNGEADGLFGALSPVVP
jgi:hypothetical protein